jgi:hypothetical protein
MDHYLDSTLYQNNILEAYSYINPIARPNANASIQKVGGISAYEVVEQRRGNEEHKVYHHTLSLIG